MVPPFMPKASAPLRVAHLRTHSAGRSSGLPATFASSAANFISSRISRLLLELAPSVARVILAPLFMASSYGNLPLPSFILEQGQCATVTPLRARISHSSSSTCTQCAAITFSPSTPSLSRYLTGVVPKFLSESATSAFVSATCMCNLRPYSLES